MIDAILGRVLGLNPWIVVTIAAVALAGAFSAGWAGGLKWEKVATLRAELRLAEAKAETDRVIAERELAIREAEIRAKTRALAQAEIDRANAALAAANIARQARDAEANAARLEEQYDDVAEALRAARAAAKDRACDCRWSDDARRRVQGIRIKPAAPVPGPRPYDAGGGNQGADPGAPRGGGDALH